MDLKDELQPFLKLVSALLFTGAGIKGLVSQQVMRGRSGSVWFEGTPAIIFAGIVLLIGLGLTASWIKDRGWLKRRTG